ncbi:hypothetical protein BH10ACT2_BH10ACT2_06300 [soil metagenome]
MDVHASLEAPCDADVLFGLVDDLAVYPHWVDLVHRADPLSDGEWDVVSDAVWQVELRARIGPLARSKRLRMKRTAHDVVARHVVFTRAEADSRRHSAWVLTADVAPLTAGSALRMHLHYGGGLWGGGLLERALADQITNGRARLAALASATR